VEQGSPRAYPVHIALDSGPDVNHISENSDRRRSKRTSVLLMGSIGRANCSSPVRIVDVSAQGSRIDCRDPGSEGEWVEFRRGEVMVRGRFVWTGGQRSGLEFEAPVDVSTLLRSMATPARGFKPRSWRPPVATSRLSPLERNNLHWWLNTPDLEGHG
jgi:hypothetical protein